MPYDPVDPYSSLQQDFLTQGDYQASTRSYVCQVCLHHGQELTVKPGQIHQHIIKPYTKLRQSTS